MADFNFVGALIILELYFAAPLYALHLASVFQINWFRRVAIAGIGFGSWRSWEFTFDPAEFAQLLRPLEVVLLFIGFAIIGLTVDAVRRAHPQGRDYLWVNLSLIIAFFTIYFSRLISSRLSRSLITYFQVFLFSQGTSLRTAF